MMSSSDAVESDVGSAMPMETDDEIDQLVVSVTVNGLCPTIFIYLLPMIILCFMRSRLKLLMSKWRQRPLRPTSIRLFRQLHQF